ncbi:DUF2474 domain-containing protein [Novilysobacter avium]|uniref:DUF2474 domain-containing protein n=1 Tax=Novilysobacter avium TaxID=2781023 RepID=A0A7S6UIX1_9GAMM|nr:DUF2474 domain-containing protein [Lysobacter avium]
MPVRTPVDGPRRPHWVRRVAWLVLIWSASVATLALVALAIKVIMRAVGMTT